MAHYRLGENLRYLLKRHRMNTAALAEASGVPRQTCHDAIYDAHVTKPVNVYKFAQVFSLTMEEILFENIQEKYGADVPARQ